MKISFEHLFIFFLPLLKYFTLLIFSLDSSADIVEPNNPHNSDLSVSHYESSKQHNLRDISLTRVKPCAQAPITFSPITFSLNISRDSLKKCIATNCKSLPPQTLYKDLDLTPFFHILITKPFSSWLLSAEHATFEVYSTVQRHITNKVNSQNSTFENTHSKQLPLKFFAKPTIVKPAKYST